MAELPYEVSGCPMILCRLTSLSRLLLLITLWIAFFLSVIFNLPVTVFVGNSITVLLHVPINYYFLQMGFVMLLWGIALRSSLGEGANWAAARGLCALQLLYVSTWIAEHYSLQLLSGGSRINATPFYLTSVAIAVASICWFLTEWVTRSRTERAEPFSGVDAVLASLAPGLVSLLFVWTAYTSQYNAADLIRSFSEKKDALWIVMRASQLLVLSYAVVVALGVIGIVSSKVSSRVQHVLPQLFFFGCLVGLLLMSLSIWLVNTYPIRSGVGGNNVDVPVYVGFGVVAIGAVMSLVAVRKKRQP